MTKQQRDVIQFFASDLKTHGATFRGLHYSSQHECVGQYAMCGQMLMLLPEYDGEMDTTLDVGCGFGYGKRVFRHLCGLDIHKSAAHIARNNMPTIAGTPHCIRSDTFDWVLGMGIFNVGYRWKDVVPVLEQMWSICRKGLCLTVCRTGEKDRDITWFHRTRWQSWIDKRANRWMSRDDWSMHQTAIIALKREF